MAGATNVAPPLPWWGDIAAPSLLTLPADACARAGQVEAAVDVLEEAIVTADTHTERFYDAELHRLKGELVLRTCLSYRTGQSHDRDGFRQGAWFIDIAP